MASKKDYRIEEYIYEMLLDLYRLECSNVFRYPVDIVASRCPDYYSVIKDPMDLSTLKVLIPYSLRLTIRMVYTKP